MALRKVMYCLFVLVVTAVGTASASEGVHVTWLWHLEQPIYWPAPDDSGVHYERAWESIQSKYAGAAHPQNNLDEIFGKDDRVAAYQWRPKDSLSTITGYDEAGVQVSYSGGLLENVQSLGEHNSNGYSASWNSSFKEGMGWTTSSGTRRLDVVLFPFHHALIPLLPDRLVRMEVELYKAVYPEAWGTSDVSKGFFPSEMAFSERNIKVLVDAGVQWVVVSNSHISRACENYPWVAGSGGDNIPPPNGADSINPAQDNYNRITIDRGVSPANAYPYAYRPHYARYIDPVNGNEYKIVVVPAAMGESWKDGYSCYGLDAADQYASTSDPAHPILVLLAHDGDNAFGGGYSYYMECVPSLASSGKAIPTTIQGYLKDHPIDASDIAHVEDGAWVNADGDFGAPMFWNWNWPLVKDGKVDPEEGWAEDERNFAVIIAAANWVLTADDIAGPADVGKILHPDTNHVLEQAWHFMLGSLNSGYMYYGKSLDMELKPVIASNTAVLRARQVLGTSFTDLTPPTIFVPQRYPDNPGGTNFGPLYGYKVTEMGPETMVWTFGYDVSGIESAVLKIRVDTDGRNDPSTDVNETYAGGSGVGSWRSITMQRRQMPTGNPFNDPEIDTSILPDEIAEVLWASFDDVSDALVDYYVEVTDSKGNKGKTAIQHVYIGDAAGQGTLSVWSPAKPCRDEVITICGEKAGFLHWGVNNWNLPDDGLWPDGSNGFGDGKSVETPLVERDDGKFCVELGPVGESVDVIDFVWHLSDGSWENNGGSDYHIDIHEDCLVTPSDLSPVDNASGSDVGGGEDIGMPDVSEGVTSDAGVSDDAGQIADASGSDSMTAGDDNAGDIVAVEDTWIGDSCCVEDTLQTGDSIATVDRGNSYDLPHMPQVDANSCPDTYQDGDLLNSDSGESSDGCAAGPASAGSSAWVLLFIVAFIWMRFLPWRD